LIKHGDGSHARKPERWAQRLFRERSVRLNIACVLELPQTRAHVITPPGTTSGIREILSMLLAVIVSLKCRLTRLNPWCTVCRMRPTVLPKPKCIFDALATSGSRSKTRWFDEENSSKSDSLMVLVLLTVNQVLAHHLRALHVHAIV